MAKSPEEMEATMIANLKEKTGRSLADWLKIVGRAGFAKHGEIVNYLKSDHAMGHGYANLVAHHHLRAQSGGTSANEDLVAAQFAGAKAELRPIYDAVLKDVQQLGSDVEVSPKKTCISFRRSKQFAMIQASTKTRVDLGINLKGQEPEGRLEASGSFSAMCTHRIRLESARDVDAEVRRWLKKANDAS